jgi:hypothetical protein
MLNKLWKLFFFVLRSPASGNPGFRNPGFLTRILLIFDFGKSKSAESGFPKPDTKDTDFPKSVKGFSTKQFPAKELTGLGNPESRIPGLNL